VRGLEAYADGFDVPPALEAAEIGELFITAVGSREVFSVPRFERNAGQCDTGERLKTMEPPCTCCRKRYTTRVPA
jgi:hypothetical protein